MTLALIKDIGVIIGAVIGLAAFIKGIIEYMHQGAQKRVEHFLEMRKRLKENEIFKDICSKVEGNDAALLKMPFKDKRDFIGFFEEIAIMMNSGLIRREVAHYMFGYYAIRCWESDNFWSGVNRGSMYWKLFEDFIIQMKDIEKSYSFVRKQYRF